MGKTGAERLRESLERKKQMKKERNARFYLKNKDKILEERKEQRRRKRPCNNKEEQISGSEVSKPNWRLYKARQRARKREEQEKASASVPVSPNSVRGAFPNRTSRKRAVDAAKNSLPRSPRKKVAVVSSLVASPSTRKSLQRLGLVNSPENEEEVQLASSIFEDTSAALQTSKRKRSNDAHTATQVSLSFLCGEKVASGRLKSKISKKIGINRKRLSTAFKHRTKTLTSSKSCWLYTERRTRSDVIPTAHRKLAHDFWSSPGISRPTGNKKDMIRKRLGVRTYTSHPKQVLDKTQTEVFLEFKAKYPEVKMGQRSFERCKPFFVIPPRSQDKITCCCRLHVETRMLFQSCMEFRKKTLAKSGQSEKFPVFEHLDDIINTTLCTKGEENSFHLRKCINRECESCGVDKRDLMNEEKDVRPEAPLVSWQKFEYVTIGQTQEGKEKRKLQLVRKETSPGAMFESLKMLLHEFSSHQFRASWQSKQMKDSIDHLPLEHVCCIHDYSENYSCTSQDQLQSQYFSQSQASIHVTILHRHALKDVDGIESTIEEPEIITEHIFVISPDTKHDHHSVHQVRELVAGYLKEIKYDVEVMHEWTDGCSAQYKSRHCMGDISFSNSDFGYKTIRNYFEMSHAKGPQDGAGANLKHKADMEVIKRKVIIQNAQDLFRFAENNLKTPAPSRYQSENVQLKRRVFFYVENVNRDRRRRYFKEVKGNRSIHSVLSGNNSCQIQTRQLSCCCENCIEENYDACKNGDYVTTWQSVQLETESAQQSRATTRSETSEALNSIKDLLSKNTTVAIASGDPGEEYYLLKITGNGPEHLEKRLKDDWGMSFPSGAEVLRGHFFVRREDPSLHSYYLEKGKAAVVYAATARYICPQLQSRLANNTEVVELSEQLHLDIIQSLNGF